MKRLLLLLAVASACGCGASNLYEVADVPSGRMVVLRSGERVLIDGIATPAEGEEGFQDSRDLLKRFVTGKRVKVVRKGEAQDGSTLADIFVEGLSVADIMVAGNAARRAKIPRRKPTKK